MKKSVTKKSNDTISPALEQEFRNLGILIEDNNNKLSYVAEQFGDVKKTLDSHTEMIGEIMTDVAVLKSDVSDLKIDVADLKSDMVIVKSDITGLKSDVSDLKKDMTIVKSDITGLKSDMTIVKSDVVIIKNNLKQKVNQDDFHAFIRK